MDPVYEGTVRDFCVFDESMHSIYQKARALMRIEHIPGLRICEHCNSRNVWQSNPRFRLIKNNDFIKHQFTSFLIFVERSGILDMSCGEDIQLLTGDPTFKSKITESIVQMPKIRQIYLQNCSV